MSHTPEPWQVVESVKQDLLGIVNLKGWNVCTMTSVDAIKDLLNAARIVEAVNGCAGLNPAAYRACVEALRQMIEDTDAAMGDVRVHAEEALAQAQAQP